jgi:hypothetical protein
MEIILKKRTLLMIVVIQTHLHQTMEPQCGQKDEATNALFLLDAHPSRRGLYWNNTWGHFYVF